MSNIYSYFCQDCSYQWRSDEVENSKQKFGYVCPSCHSDNIDAVDITPDREDEHNDLTLKAIREGDIRIQ